MSETKRVKVWDGATRLFHWLLVFLLGFSWLSVRKGWIEWHMYSGYSIGALLIFRLVWGFIGSETARFRQFLASPFEAVLQLLKFHKKTDDVQVGHNAAGGWMVIAMLLLLSAQVITGLGTSDDISSEGPLVRHLGTQMSDRFAFLHARIFTLIKIAAALHLLAITAYFIIKRHNLLYPMLHGFKQLPIDTEAPRIAHPIRAWVVFLVATAIMYYVATEL